MSKRQKREKAKMEKKLITKSTKLSSILREKLSQQVSGEIIKFPTQKETNMKAMLNCEFFPFPDSPPNLEKSVVLLKTKKNLPSLEICEIQNKLYNSPFSFISFTSTVFMVRNQSKTSILPGELIFLDIPRFRIRSEVLIQSEEEKEEKEDTQEILKKQNQNQQSTQQFQLNDFNKYFKSRFQNHLNFWKIIFQKTCGDNCNISSTSTSKTKTKITETNIIREIERRKKENDWKDFNIKTLEKLDPNMENRTMLITFLDKIFPKQSRPQLSPIDEKTIAFASSGYYSSPDHFIIYKSRISSLFRESCTPNAFWEIDARDVLRIYAISPIKSGEEITLSRCPMKTRNVFARRLFLQSAHLRSCNFSCCNNFTLSSSSSSSSSLYSSSSSSLSSSSSSSSSSSLSSSSYQQIPLSSMISWTPLQEDTWRFWNRNHVGTKESERYVERQRKLQAWTNELSTHTKYSTLELYKMQADLLQPLYCAGCGKAGFETETKLKRCKNCRLFSFCDLNCQKIAKHYNSECKEATKLAKTTRILWPPTPTL